MRLASRVITAMFCTADERFPFGPGKNHEQSGGNMSGWAFLVGLFGIASAILWIIIGWRAMRAHERIADAAEQAARKMRESEK